MKVLILFAYFLQNIFLLHKVLFASALDIYLSSVLFMLRQLFLLVCTLFHFLFFLPNVVLSCLPRLLVASTSATQTYFSPYIYLLYVPRSSLYTVYNNIMVIKSRDYKLRFKVNAAACCWGDILWVKYVFLKANHLKFNRYLVRSRHEIENEVYV